MNHLTLFITLITRENLFQGEKEIQIEIRKNKDTHTRDVSQNTIFTIISKVFQENPLPTQISSL